MVQKYCLDYLIDKFENKWVEKITNLPYWVISVIQEVDCVFLFLLCYAQTCLKLFVIIRGFLRFLLGYHNKNPRQPIKYQ
jgi:hypothetical protein